MCENCNQGIAETVKHIMAECPAYDMIREWAMNKLIEAIGREEFDRVVALEEYGMAYFLGLEDGVPERVVNIIKTLLCSIWAQRSLLAQEGEEVMDVQLRDVDSLDGEIIILRRR